MRDLTVVMPVYNEAACICEVLDSWLAVLGRLGVEFTILVLNDGSRDNTAAVLEKYRDTAGVTVVNKPNSGHGPTILQGYHTAAAQSQWVFQVDSDNEMEARHFVRVWEAREGRDAVIGVRDGRAQPLPRKVISAVSRLIVRLFYGHGIADVNCPFRLMKSAALAPLLEKIPEDTFAPNVAIAGLLVRRRLSVCNVPIPHSDRQTGEVSIRKWKLFKAAVKSCMQTIRISRI